MNDKVKKILKMYSIFICVGCLLGVVVSVIFSKPDIKPTQEQPAAEAPADPAKGDAKAP